ncbi:MAG: 3-hydroxyacyl-CoA dehydrogenase [Bacteroidetes bacterium]|nr:3-hydroxyacyl-CoA dehydrogenase [Bacteroidota bacterium]
MQTGILGSPAQSKAWQLLAGENNACTWLQDTQSSKNFNLVIDLEFDDHPERILEYAGNTETIFLLGAVKITPELAFANAGIAYSGEKIFGINSIPSFLERKTLEISNPFSLDIAMLAELKWWDQMEWVKSRVGMVTPRIVFMIINEAYFTFQEGTATREDINAAMKLGTNYPRGPFEWCEVAGIANVYETLLAVYEDTRDERYKICPALKSEYLLQNIR